MDLSADKYMHSDQGFDISNPYHLYYSWAARVNFIKCKPTYSKKYQIDLSKMLVDVSRTVTDRIFGFFSACLYASRD